MSIYKRTTFSFILAIISIIMFSNMVNAWDPETFTCPSKYVNITCQKDFPVAISGGGAGFFNGQTFHSFGGASIFKIGLTFGDSEEKTTNYIFNLVNIKDLENPIVSKSFTVSAFDITKPNYVEFEFPLVYIASGQYFFGVKASSSLVTPYTAGKTGDPYTYGQASTATFSGGKIISVQQTRNNDDDIGFSITGTIFDGTYWPKPNVASSSNQFGNCDNQKPDNIFNVASATAWGVCQMKNGIGEILSWLFIPDPNSVSQSFSEFNTYRNDIIKKPPFGYIGLASDTISIISNEVADNPLNSSPDYVKLNMFGQEFRLLDLCKYIIQLLLALILIFYFFHRVKRIISYLS